VESVDFEMKGTAVLTQMEFVRSRFGEDKYRDWVAALDKEAREVVEGTVFASSWYKGKPLVIGTRRAICDLFYDGDPRGAKDLGLFAAEMGLGGVYKVFVRIGSPNWVAGRAAVIFSQYFKPGHIEVVSREKNGTVLRLIGFPDETGLLEQTVAGFGEGAVIVSGGKNVVVEITKSYSKGDEYAEFVGSWE
jgi:hypothetical protein